MSDALLALGELYRDAAGHEVWRIKDRSGAVVAEDVASDNDAKWIAERVWLASTLCACDEPSEHLLADVDGWHCGTCKGLIRDA